MVDEIVLKKLRAEFGDRVAVERYAQRARAEARAALERSREGIGAAERALAKVAEQEQRMRRLFREGDLSLEEYREQRADLAAERTEVSARLEQVSSAVAQAEAAQAALDQDLGMAERVAEAASLPVEQQKHLLRHFAESVTLFRRPGAGGGLTCEVVWRWTGARPPEEEAVQDRQ
ncbi:MAG TPA: hypothetical protein VNT75_23300, partial [Symbiobacteriaceae bacterium]|nr:hypothetical protein [Symbiobacteriaceae bacterium]